MCAPSKFICVSCREVIHSSNAVAVIHVARKQASVFIIAYWPRNIRPVWLVPTKNPPPASWFCRTTPLNFTVLPVAGSVTVPLRRPLEVVTVIFRVELVLVTLLEESMATWLVKLLARLPFANQSSAGGGLSTGTPLVKW